MAVPNATLEALIKGWRERAAATRAGRDELYGEGLEEAADALEKAVKERRMPIPVAVHDLPVLWRERATAWRERGRPDAQAMLAAAVELEAALAEEAPHAPPSAPIRQRAVASLPESWRARGGDGFRTAANELERALATEPSPGPATPSEAPPPSVQALPALWRAMALLNTPGGRMLEDAASALEKALAAAREATRAAEVTPKVPAPPPPSTAPPPGLGKSVATDECVIAIALSPTERLYWTGSESKWSPYLGDAQVMFVSTVGAVDHSGAALAMPGAKLYGLALVEIEVKR